MPKLPNITAQELITTLEKIDFAIVRQKGSHVRLKHADGRVDKSACPFFIPPLKVVGFQTSGAV